MHSYLYNNYTPYSLPLRFASLSLACLFLPMVTAAPAQPFLPFLWSQVALVRCRPWSSSPSKRPVCPPCDWSPRRCSAATETKIPHRIISNTLTAQMPAFGLLYET
ncbi:hypothetical protein LY76DRAFT_59090 [Colletotrichum caudatum]|nr:hypothetical protein LY76DRAFT_59090 [Colletotrichum caudatum]